MWSQVDRSPTQPMYVFWMLMFVAGFSLLQFGLVARLYYGIYGAPTLNEWRTSLHPNYVHAAMWKDRVWYPVMKFGPGQPGGYATLMSFDPVKGDTNESKIKIPFPTIGLVGDRERLWAVSPGFVHLTEGDDSTGFKTNRLLKNACEPFLYQGQLAVIDLVKNGPRVLLVFQDKDWVEVGPVVLPSDFATAMVDGKTVLVHTPDQSPAPATLLDLQVVADHGRIHTFLSNGAVVAYREGLELSRVSALAPANGTGNLDLSNISDWEIACSVAQGLAFPVKNRWKAVLVDGKPAIVNVSLPGPNPLQGGSLLSYGRIEGSWRKIAQTATPAMLELLAVSDGHKSFVAAQSLVQLLRFHRLTDAGLSETGAILKAPATGYEQPLQRIVRLYQFVFWIGLVVWALAVSRLMAAYRDPAYQSGMSIVELASFTRRTIARIIDWLVYLGPFYIVTYLFGFTSKEQAERNLDKFFEPGPDGVLMRLVYWTLASLICGLSLLIVNSVIQGRWGVTLGKWICGIRTVRSTLCPCGFARAMVRELLLVCECLMAITWIPVTLLVAFTRCQQRAGDLVADTIVIRKATKPPEVEFK